MKRLFIVVTCVLLSQFTIGQTPDSLKNNYLVLDLTLFDLPYQTDAGKTVNNGDFTFGSFFKGYANPSMDQSLSLSTSLISSAHYGIDNLFNVQRNYFKTKRKFWHLLTLLIVDNIITYAPGGEGWLHEEYHRAVMSRYHVNSFDDMNTFPIGASSVSVNNIKDEGLVRFKQESPPDFIRMHVAGIEGQYMLVDRLQRNTFFYDQYITHEISSFMSILNGIMYVGASSKPDEVDKMTDEFNQKESEISERDFTGFDFSAWAYDLFNPNEPYENRGGTPSWQWD